MKKILFVILCICFIFTVNAQADVYDTIRQSSVSIFSVGNSGSGICSGTVIENTLYGSKVLTAKHCIDIFEAVYVEKIEISYLIASKDDDMALLILNQHIPNKTPAILAYTNAYQYEPVFHVGYPDLEEYAVNGHVYLPKGDSHYAKMIVIPGCSGGGLFNEDGQLVGVVWGSTILNVFTKNELTIYEPLTDIKRFLRNLK